LTGWKKEELLHCNWSDVFIPTERREKVKNTHILIQSGLVEIPTYEENELVTKDGHRLIIGWNNTTLKDSNGNFIGVSHIGEIITKKVLQITGNNVSATSIDKAIVPQVEYSPISGTVVGNYVVIKPIKGGETGHVQLALHKETREPVAVKVLKKELMTPEEQERARREMKIMKLLTSLKNPYIVRLLEAQETDTHFTLIVEYLSGGELLSYIKQQKGLSEQEAQRLFKQLLCAIECCHSQKIIHRDIKLQNILLDGNNDLKLIDFGLSNFTSKGLFRNTFCGTPAYAAPEILLGTQYEGPEVDVWSLGVVLYVMLTTEFPFNTIGDILKGSFKEPSGISQGCLDLLKSMLTIDKDQRTTLSEVLNHSWVLKHFDPASPGTDSGDVTEGSSTNSPQGSPLDTVDSPDHDGVSEDRPLKKRKLTQQPNNEASPSEAAGLP